jgi:N-acetylmuramic acid 6-phosphate etherase
MQLEEFLKSANYFSLGHLPTEGFHNDTRQLSDWVLSGRDEDLAHAIRVTQKIDLAAIEKIKNEMPSLLQLQQDVAATFARGKKVFLSGCGATGRLALTLETTWRKIHAGTAQENHVQALMAGGDFALVKSVENFEDFPEYGERHLADLGFTSGDLLIAITEGGETPYVIGTLHGALKTSMVKHWFVYCNPKDLLCQTVERSREVIENPRVNSLCLDIGPMALSGSTRLQAATVQMLAVGAALLNRFDLIDEFLTDYAKLDLAPFLIPAIHWESKAYLNQGVVLYQTSSYPIAVLTDTTERSPTFSLTPFEKSNEPPGGPFSLCYLSIPDAHGAMESWKRILNRAPIGLEWPELNGRLGLDSILEFDFGREATATREARVAPKKQNVIRLDSHATLHEVEFKTSEFDSRLKTDLVAHPLTEQIFVKVLLNTLSLMVMGFLHRYEGNVMTWVRPSNGKLIDRTIRYLEFLIQKRGLKPVVREQLAKMIFETQPKLSPDDAIILNILNQLKA